MVQILPKYPRLRIGLATAATAFATSMCLVWLIERIKWFSMASFRLELSKLWTWIPLFGDSSPVTLYLESSQLLTVAFLAGAVVTYYAVRLTGKGGPGSLAARASAGVVIFAGAISMLFALFTQRYLADTITLMFLDGLLLRGLIPLDIARLPVIVLFLIACATGIVWGAAAIKKQEDLRKQAGDDAPQSMVSSRQLVTAGVVAAFAYAGYLYVPGAKEWIDTAVNVIAGGNVEVVRDYLLQFGAWAAVISATLMVLQSIVAPLPAFVMTFSNGLLFGWAWGALLSWSSAMAGAALCFWLARSLGRPVVERLAGGSAALDVSDVFFERYGERAVLIARLLPFVSFDIISYGAGLTSMNFRKFFIATGIGQLPATLVYSYLGQNLTGSVQVLFQIFAFTVVVFIVGATVRPYFMKRIRREAKTEETS